MTATRHAAAATLLAVLLVSTAARAAEHVPHSQTVFLVREQWLAAFERLSPPALQAAVLRCDRAARRTMLDFEDGVRCAMAWDALLRRVYGNDLDALLEWWRAHRDRSTVD